MHIQRSQGIGDQCLGPTQAISLPLSHIASTGVGLKKKQTNKHGSYHTAGIFYPQRVDSQWLEPHVIYLLYVTKH